MKILLANKYLYPRGGDCIYTLRLMNLLTMHGHQVALFSMRHPENMESEYEDYFVDHIDFREQLKSFSISSAVSVLSRAIVNRQSAKQMERLIADFEPDVIHLQNIHHQLTPAIIEPAARNGIPVVWTLHDYTLLCPDHLLLRQGQICEKCADGSYYQAVLNRCKKGSLAASLVAAIECSLYRPSKLARNVARFVCPSQFLADVLTRYGLPERQVINVPNFLPALDIEPKKPEHFLYVGRLSKEKGVETLLEAFSRLDRGKLVIVGDGPIRAQLEQKAIELKVKGVEFLGQQPQQRVFELLSRSLASIVPSICYENFPFTVLEAMATRKAVIASRMGGMPEQVVHGKTGLLFEAGNAAELTRYMTKLLDNPRLASDMGEEGYSKVSSEYGPRKHCEQIIQVYQEAIDKSNNRTATQHQHRRIFESTTAGVEGR